MSGAMLLDLVLGVRCLVLGVRAGPPLVARWFAAGESLVKRPAERPADDERALPASARASSTSERMTSKPASAETCAMPLPIRPEPMTPIIFMA